MPWKKIENRREFAAFLEEVNGLHDGYLVSAVYEHRGLEGGNPLLIDDSRTTLILRFLVTSLHNTPVELAFDAVRAWKIKEEQTEILDSSVSFTDDGLLVWRSEPEATSDALREADHLVIAEAMKWRIVSADE